MSEQPTVYEKAQALAAASKNQAALLAFEAAFRAEPENFRAAFGVGLMFQRLEEHGEAIEAFFKVIKLQPRLAEAYYSRALSLQKLARLEDALIDLDKALELSPDYIDAMYARGLSLKGLERYDEALEAFSATLKKAGAYPPASRGRASLRELMGDHAGAVADFSDCLNSGMDNYDIRLLRGLALHRLGRLAEAIEDLTAAIAFRPEEGTTYLRRWDAYAQMGEKLKADQDFATGTRLMDAAKNKRESSASA